MVSMLKIGGNYGVNIMEICGLSTDDKPIDKVNETDILNGSTFLEMDTKKIFIFSKSDETWYEI